MTRAKRQELAALFEEHFPHVILPKVRRINEKLERMLKLKPRIHDCCINSCQAFTGKDSGALACRFCHSSRYHTTEDGKHTFRPRKEWVFFPLAPRLALQYQGDRAQVLTEYRASFDNARSSNFEGWRDVFDGDLYQDLIDPALVDRSQRGMQDDHDFGPIFTE